MRCSSVLHIARTALERGDGGVLEQTFNVARAARRTWAEGKVK